MEWCAHGAIVEPNPSSGTGVAKSNIFRSEFRPLRRVRRGKDRILQIGTLRIYGYGQQAYQNGGGNVTASPDAPQKWVNINGSERSIDLEHGRMRLKQRQVRDFVFAYERNMTGRGPAATQMLDADIAFNVGAAKVTDKQTNL